MPITTTFPRPSPRHGRFSGQTRPDHPDRKPPLCERAHAMGETMRAILYRDGYVTEAALVSEGFAAAEIVEYSEEAREHARLTITICGHAGDRLPAIIGKARNAVPKSMPMPAAMQATAAMRAAWFRYCRAKSCFLMDPWIAQQERALGFLRDFLGLLPLLPRERNAVVCDVAASLNATRRRVEA